MSFVHGFLLAFGLILPLGVQNMFIFNQGAVQPRFVRALPAVLTASFCDLLLILLAVFGVSVVVLGIPVVKYLFLCVGILFLLYMGYTTWKNAAPKEASPADGSSTSDSAAVHNTRTALVPGKQVLFAASVSLLNPHAILDTIGVIGTSSLQYQGFDKALFASACILVSFIWFFFLAIMGRWIGQVNQAILPIINRISAVIMWGSAVYLLKSFL